MQKWRRSFGAPHTIAKGRFPINPRAGRDGSGSIAGTADRKLAAIGSGARRAPVTPLNFPAVRRATFKRENRHL